MIYDKVYGRNLNLFKTKLFNTSIILLLYLYLMNLPIYGLDFYTFKEVYSQSDLFEMPYVNIFFGNSINKLTYFGLSIVPYLTSSIIIYVFTMKSDYFKKLREDNPLLLNLYIYTLTILLSGTQSYFIVKHFIESLIKLDKIYLLPFNIYCFTIYAVLLLITGTFIIILLSKIVDEYGLGLGIPFIISVNILSFFILKLYHFYRESGSIQFYIVLLLLLSVFALSFTLQKKYNKIFMVFPIHEYNKIINDFRLKKYSEHFHYFCILPYEFVGILPIVFFNIISHVLKLNNGPFAISCFFKITLLIILYKLTIYMSLINMSFLKPAKRAFSFFPHINILNSTVNYIAYIFNLRFIYIILFLSYLLIVPQYCIEYLDIKYDLSTTNILSIFILTRLVQLIYLNIRTKFF